MNEASARRVLLLQALEGDGDPGSPRGASQWTAQDSAWASRMALESSGTSTAPDAFVAERARHAMERFAPRAPAVAQWLARRAWRPLWWVAAAGVGLLAGLVADAVASGQRINLLAPPFWGVVVWNLLVYVWLVWEGLHSVLARRKPSAGGARGLVRWLQRLMAQRGNGAANLPVGQAFALSWARHSAPLSTARAVGLLHTAAAALGLGLLAGMYARGLVLDFRAGWESTFLSAGQVHAALSLLLAPALGLSATALPEPAALEALRFSPAYEAAGASAAPWIHLYALTLVLFVLIPRLALAGWSAWRARALSRRFPLPLDVAYFQRLLRYRQGGAARVQVLPYAQAASPQAEQGLRAVFRAMLGEAAQVHVAPVVAFGEEEALAAAQRVPAGTTLVAALFDLTATPEAENHGRFVELLAQAAQQPARSGTAAAVVMLVDETAFARRFGSPSERIGQRREAWRKLAESLRMVPVFVNLAAPDLAAAERALQAAVGGPAHAAAA